MPRRGSTERISRGRRQTTVSQQSYPQREPPAAEHFPSGSSSSQRSTTAAGGGARMGFQLFVVYANLAMYAFCFQMQQPVLPATVKALVSVAVLLSVLVVAAAAAGIWASWSC